jgi:WD40 repeat protein
VKLWDVATGRERATLGGTVKLKVSLHALSYLKAEGVPRSVRLKLAVLNGKEFPSEEDFDKELPGILEKLLDKDQRAKYLNLVRSQIESVRQGPEVVWSLAFSPDGKTLATASVLGTILLWDVQTGKRRLPLHRFNPNGREQDINPAYSVAFSRDGKFLAAGTGRGLTVWDVESGDKVVPLSRPAATVWSVAFSSDGKTVATAGSKGVIGKHDRREGDPTIQLWEWDPAKKVDK